MKDPENTDGDRGRRKELRRIQDLTAVMRPKIRRTLSNQTDFFSSLCRHSSRVPKYILPRLFKYN